MTKHPHLGALQRYLVLDVVSHIQILLQFTDCYLRNGESPDSSSDHDDEKAVKTSSVWALYMP